MKSPLTGSRKSLESAVVLHLGDNERFDEFEPFLKTAPARDLIVTTTRPPSPALSALFASHGANHVLVPDGGRDLGAFLHVLPLLFERGYRSVLKLHTLDAMTSPFCPWKPALKGQRAWREDLFRQLLHRGAEIEDAFRLLPRLGLVTGEGHLIHFSESAEGSSEKIAELKNLYRVEFLPQSCRFAAGSMFWARLEAFRSLVENVFPHERFERDEQPGAPTWAHAFERVISLIPLSSGYQLKSLDEVRLSPTEGENAPLFSVITRFHNLSYLDHLLEAGSSLKAQTHRPIEWLIVTKDFSEPQLRVLDERLQPFRNDLAVRVIPAHCEPGVDGRSHLLNRGLAEVKGRFVSFLDYDDLLSPSYAEVMIGLLRNATAAIAAVGCEQILIHASTRKKIRTIHYYRQGHRLTLCWHNIIPIHAFAMDRRKVDAELLRFDETLDRCEDYEFLLRANTGHELDLSLLHFPLCQYRIRDDGTNTSLDGRTDVPSADRLAWDEAFARVQERKK
ncbi:MAG TPA: rhamnan synthesis F family protein, partial [Hyalangium sp.]|nr:rhamnan synthesis F family protein [Hyalangium sp.]